jgi:hypothetical protein
MESTFAALFENYGGILWQRIRKKAYDSRQLE